MASAGADLLLIGTFGSSHLDRQQVALRINERVPFPAPDFFPHIVALLGTANRTGSDRLAVDDSRTRLFISTLFSAHLHPQRTQDLIPHAFALPSAKVVVDGAPGGKLVGQQAPRTATAQHVQDGIDQFASRVYVIGSLCRKR